MGSLALGASWLIVFLLNPWKYLGCCAHTPEAIRAGEGASPDVVSKLCAACVWAPSRRTVSMGARQFLRICFIRPPHRNLGDNTILQKGKYPLNTVFCMALCFSALLYHCFRS